MQQMFLSGRFNIIRTAEELVLHRLSHLGYQGLTTGRRLIGSLDAGQSCDSGPGNRGTNRFLDFASVWDVKVLGEFASSILVTLAKASCRTE